MFWSNKYRFLSRRNIPASSDQLITRSVLKYGPFGPIYDVLSVFGSFRKMQLLAYLLQAAGHVLLLDWITSKQFLSHFYWMLWWLATKLGFIGQNCG